MTAMRVAFHADAEDAKAWIDGKARPPARSAAEDIAEGRRQSLRAFGFRVVEPTPQE